MTSSHDVESVERLIAAPPEPIFALLADPSRHHEIDGSGSVKDAKEGARRGGRIWRYELEPVEGGTLVRETWDISHERVKLAVRPMRGKTRRAMEQTLARIEQIVTA
jgi:uncharacterized protein YndB with AHSA1/START domain